MAGKKGRSGGARPNSGPKPKLLNVKATDDPLKFLLAVMNDPTVDAKLRVRSAITATQYKHNKKGNAKKEEQKRAADKASRGRLAPSAPPKLALVAAAGKKIA